MNIVMFTNTYLPHVGGVARSVSFFTEDLRRLGHNVLVIAPEYGDEEEDGEEPGHILRMPAIQNFNGSDFSLRLPVPFVIDERLDRFGPDLIHSHHPYLLGDTAMRQSRYRSVPLVFTHHTLYEQYTHYVPMDSDALRRFVIHLSTEYANLCDCVIAPSMSVAELIRSRGVTAPVEEIPTGVDMEFFRSGDRTGFRKKYGIPEDAFVVGHLGRLAPEKNLDFLTRAVIVFLEKRPEAMFLAVGGGPSAESIETAFSRHGLADRLILTGPVTGNALRDAYHAMDLFAFSSRSETQGMVLAEAMSAGLPVVALDASGVREVLTDRRNGRMLDKNASPETFANALEELAESGSGDGEYRQAALETARRFSREVTVKKLERLYETTLARYRPERFEIQLMNGKRQELTGWETLLHRLKAEWDLMSEKTAAAIKALTEDEEPAGNDEPLE